MLPEEANICLYCFTESENLHITDLSEPEFRERKLSKNIAAFASGTVIFSVIFGILLTALVVLPSIGITQNPLTPLSSVSDGDTQNNGENGEEDDSDGFFLPILSEIFDKDDDKKEEPDSENQEPGSSSKDESDNSTPDESEESSAPGGNPSGVTLPGQTITGETSQNDSQNSVQEPSTQNPGSVLNPSTPETDSFEYEDYSGNQKYISITKYTGNSKNVTVPAQIDGRYVVEISSGTFSENSKIETISFESDSGVPYLWIRRGCISSLSNLKTINLPDADLGIINGFADNCLALENINVDNWQFRCVDGVLYYYNSSEWVIRHICPSGTGSTLTVPSWCKGFEGSCNLKEAYQVKTLNIHKACTYLSVFNMINGNLEAITVESGHPTAISRDGVLFKSKNSQGHYTSMIYPPAKKDKVFKMPDNTSLSFDAGFSNSYLETLWIPKTASVSASAFPILTRYFKNLKTVYLEKGSAYTESAGNFPGELILY